jgi:hypothetical protein
MKNDAKLMIGLVFGWFILSLTLSAFHAFLNPANRLGLAVAFAAVGPVALFSIWRAASPKFRSFTMSLDPRALVFLQTARALGVVFIILEARGVLPALFARPAGYGDIFIGITAPLVALWLAVPRHRLAFIAWQLLGITDLVVAVGLGVSARLIDPASIPMVAVTVLPLSLIPTFLVPLFLILHLVSISQARTWQPASGGSLQAPAPSRT